MQSTGTKRKVMRNLFKNHLTNNIETPGPNKKVVARKWICATDGTVTKFPGDWTHIEVHKGETRKVCKAALEEIALNEKYGQLRVFVAAGATDLSMDGTGGTMSILYVAHSKEEAVASLVASVMGPLTRLNEVVKNLGGTITVAPIIQPAYDHHTLAERYRETIEMSRRKINREINHHNVRVRGKALQLDIVMQKIAGKNRDINRKFYEGRTSNLNPLREGSN